MKREPLEHRMYSCAVCKGVMALRVWEAMQSPEADNEAEKLRRCPDCAFCYGRHAPDCAAIAEVTHLAQLGIETD
jgi:hypothetical protein